MRDNVILDTCAMDDVQVSCEKTVSSITEHRPEDLYHLPILFRLSAAPIRLRTTACFDPPNQPGSSPSSKTCKH
jgi:hypothetical protein